MKKIIKNIAKFWLYVFFFFLSVIVIAIIISFISYIFEDDSNQTDIYNSTSEYIEQTYKKPKKTYNIIESQSLFVFSEKYSDFNEKLDYCSDKHNIDASECIDMKAIVLYEALSLTKSFDNIITVCDKSMYGNTDFCKYDISKNIQLFKKYFNEFDIYCKSHHDNDECIFFKDIGGLSLLEEQS